MDKYRGVEFPKAAADMGRKPSPQTPSPDLSGQSNTSAPNAAALRKMKITDAYLEAASPAAFGRALSEIDYLLAVGDHGSFLVVDVAGNQFNLGNQIEGLSFADLRTWLGAFPATLPKVDAAKAIQKAKRGTFKKTRNVVKRVALPAGAAMVPKSRSGSETRNSTQVVATRYNAEELARIDQRASDANMTRATYVRTQTLDIEPKTRSTRRPNIAVQEVAKLTAQLGKVGSNLNQIAKAANLGRTLSGMLEVELMALQELRPLLFKAMERKP